MSTRTHNLVQLSAQHVFIEHLIAHVGENIQALESQVVSLSNLVHANHRLFSLFQSEAAASDIASEFIERVHERLSTST